MVLFSFGGVSTTVLSPGRIWNAGLNWWKGLGFHAMESLEEEVMREYGDFVQTLEIQAREQGMDPQEVTQKFIMRWETQKTHGIRNQMRSGPKRR